MNELFEPLICKLPNCYYPINCTRRQECLAHGGEIMSDSMRSSKYDIEEFSDGKGRTRHGSPTFYKLLQEAAETHDKKSHDYASNDNPAGNYHFAGTMSQLFKDPRDAGFIGRVGEKLYRLANIENRTFAPEGTMEAKVMNESIEDTETDIFTIIGLWISDRRNRRNKK